MTNGSTSFDRAQDKQPATNGFWEQLPRPFWTLAPLYDVTDCAFREMIARRKLPPPPTPTPPPRAGGGPHVMFTEFVSVDGLCHEKSREKLIKLHFGFTETQRPIVAQLWGSDPEKFRVAAGIVQELGFDGIDINMGCPDKKVVVMGAGAGLIKNPKLAQEIIYAVRDGSTKLTTGGGTSLPVSVKTRTGYSQSEIDSWIPALLETGLAALTIHARTMKDMSKVPAKWEEVKRVVEMAHSFSSPNRGPARMIETIRSGGGQEGYTPTNSPFQGEDQPPLVPPKIRGRSNTVIIGNGDVRSLAEAKARVAETGCDGVMIGRAIFGNYWFFSGNTNGHEQGVRTDTNVGAANNSGAERINVRVKLNALVEHAELFERYYKGLKNFMMLRKHFAEFAKGFNGARELRMALMEAESAAEVRAIVDAWPG